MQDPHGRHRDIPDCLFFNSFNFSVCFKFHNKMLKYFMKNLKIEDSAAINRKISRIQKQVFNRRKHKCSTNIGKQFYTTYNQGIQGNPRPPWIPLQTIRVAKFLISINVKDLEIIQHPSIH